jgi:hypothetical protein
MVHKEEHHSSWWPLGRWHSSKDCTNIFQDVAAAVEEDDSDCERAFDIADCLEMGLACEVVTDFMHPLRRSRKLWQFQVTRSEDKLQHRLYTEDGDFLMYALTLPEQRRVNFFLYNPEDTESGKLFDPARPAFTMSWNAQKTEWRLVQEKCEYCQFSPRHLSCGACCGKQQVAFIKHSRKDVGDGVFNHMDLRIPGLYADESRVIWCSKLGRGDLGADHLENNCEFQSMATKPPTWNEEVDGLVLDFKGRKMESSAKNFQLAFGRKPEHVVCQFGKIGENRFALDFRYPLSCIQAFGISLTTMSWQ